MRHHYYTKAIFSLLVISVFIIASPAKAESLMQCMTSCVKHEGNTAAAKATCKSRCAQLPPPRMSKGNPPSCMAVYKKCNRSCPAKNKACQRQCKAALMECK